MNIIDLRKSLRRTATSQRLADRRQVPYEFGTAEWLAHMQAQQIDYPSENRRKGERRTEKRQLPDRRQTHETTSHPDKKYTRIFLSPSEKKLLEDLYLIDLETTLPEFNEND